MRRWTWVLASVVGTTLAVVWLVSVLLRAEGVDALVTGQVQVAGGGLQTTVLFEFEGEPRTGIAAGYTDAGIGDEIPVWFTTPWTDRALGDRVEVALELWELWLVPAITVGIGLLWVGWEVFRARRQQGQPKA